MITNARDVVHFALAALDWYLSHACQPLAMYLSMSSVLLIMLNDGLAFRPRLIVGGDWSCDDIMSSVAAADPTTAQSYQSYRRVGIVSY